MTLSVDDFAARNTHNCNELQSYNEEDERQGNKLSCFCLVSPAAEALVENQRPNDVHEGPIYKEAMEVLQYDS